MRSFAPITARTSAWLPKIMTQAQQAGVLSTARILCIFMTRRADACGREQMIVASVMNDVTSASVKPYLRAVEINLSLRMLSRAGSCSANTVPGDQLGGGSYDCTLRDCDCYFAGIPAGSRGKPQCRRGPPLRSWQALRVQLF